MGYERLFLFSICFTIAVETAVLFLMVRKIYGIDAKKIPGALLFFSGFFASFATLPYLWFLLPAFLKDYWLLVVAGEAGVFLIEAAFYKFTLGIDAKKAIAISAACNAASFFLGLAVVR